MAHVAGYRHRARNPMLIMAGVSTKAPPEPKGLELIEQINRIAPETPVIMVTGFATVSSAVEALKKGAAYYLGKPGAGRGWSRSCKSLPGAAL